METILYIWVVLGTLHVLFLLFKMLPHFKSGYEHYFWLGLWIYKPSSLSEEGKKIRLINLLAMIFYLFGWIILNNVSR
jgi:hypothetical protein